MTDNMVKARPLWEQVVNHIISDIRNGEMIGGDRIVEAQLARKLKISRNPIREACRQLQQKNILEYQPNIGTVVKKFSKEDALLILETRIFLEQKAIHLIRSHKSQEKMDEVAQIVEKMSHLKNNVQIYQIEGLDYKFHCELIIASGSTTLKNLWETIDPYTKMIMYSWQISNRKILVNSKLEYEKHKKLLDLMQSAATKTVESAIYHHIMDVFKTTLSAFN